jgi:hypothetical protein
VLAVSDGDDRADPGQTAVAGGVHLSVVMPVYNERYLVA